MTLAELERAFADGELPKADYIEQIFRLHRQLFDYADFLRRTGISAIEVSERGVLMRARDGDLLLKCDPDDRRLAPIEILNFGHFEAAELAMVLALVEPNATVFDIGANIGWYSMQLARRVPGVRLFAFEPVPKTYRLLQEHLALNGISTVRTFPYGFSDRAGEITFYVDPQGSGNASAANLTGLERVQQVTCRVERVDDVARELEARVDFIKCDVEGAELLVFRGAEDTLRRQRPAVFVEMLRKWALKFDYHPNDTIAHFASLGYRCFALHGERLAPFTAMDETTTETNFFFLDPVRHAAALARLTA
ncbi:MAG: FkbM family methyltransferase [Acidobacteriota bacterium]